MTWLFQNWQQALSLTLEHIYLSVVPIVIGLVIALPIGMLLYRTKVARRVAVVLSSVVFTIPSLALFVAMPAVVGTQILDPLNVIIALSLYSVALLVRTVFESLDSVDEDVRQASIAIGTSPLKQAVFNDLPLSIPVLTAGVRVVAVTNVSMVSVGAVIGIGGLGQLFTIGYQRSYPDQILAGIIVILLLAFVFDRLLAFIGRALTPWTRVEQNTRRGKTRRPKGKKPATDGSAPGVAGPATREVANVR